MKNLLFLLFLCSSLAYSQQTDAFSDILSKMGISEKNLGYSPKGYWTRYPEPSQIPYKLPSFDALMAEPQRIYDFVRNMGLAADDFLNPEYMSKNTNGLLRTAFYCGVRNASGQFREYSASLWSEVDEKEPMLKAIKEIYTKTGKVFTYNAMGKASDFPLIEKNLRDALKPLHPEIQKVVAKTILHLLEAWRFREIGMRNVDFRNAVDCWRIRDLGETQFDGLEYYPQLEDCAQKIDINSIYYAGYKMLESSEQLADTLKKLRKSLKDIDWKAQNFNYVTPIGRIVISGTKDDTHEYSDLLFLLDLGGDDTYKGAIGSTPSLQIPISLAIDLEGNDTYINNDEYLPTQGAAMFGAAMLFDCAGNDKYISTKIAQGSAILGIGILADLEGDDEYTMWSSGQGAAYFGVGLAIDGSGDDKYKIHGDGQGFGGVGGVGTLINRSGNDSYYAEPESKVVFRPDYHSKDGKLNYSYAQGCGIGRRGDITDGHSWSGGMGTLIDVSGDDKYTSANWSLGCGYWYGMGFCYDGGGNDKYTSASWSMANGAHFGIGAIIDEKGDDEYTMWAEQSAGMAFGHDYVIALFLDKEGNDKYQMKDDGFGWAINMSQAFFIDMGGNDTYIRGGKGKNYGMNNFETNNPPKNDNFYHLFSDQLSIFADLKGEDKYSVKDFESGKESSDSLMQNNFEKFCPENKDTLANKRYYGIGIDHEYKDTNIEYFRDKLQSRIPKKKE